MHVPTAADYNEAMQNLHAVAGDDELRGGQVACNHLGLPMPYAGNFADVYQVRCAERNVAVKCFKTAATGLRRRYREISAHLQRAHLPFMVDFRFVEQGLRLNGAWYPVLKMDWVEAGIGLNQFVHQYADRPSMLRDLLALWVRVAARLQQAKVTHADLQHGNVLLVPVKGTSQLSLKLVDYDGMYVPALANVPSGELGHPCYQHPQRLREGIYSPHVDRFSHLVIYTSVRAVIAGGQPLWERFNTQENLLFQAADFARPSASDVFRELWTLRDPEARALAGHLSLATGQPLEAVPALSDLMEGEFIRPLTLNEEAQVAALLHAGRTVGALPATGSPAWWQAVDTTDGAERIDLISGKPDSAASSTGTVPTAGSAAQGTQREVKPARQREPTHEPVLASKSAATDNLPLLLRPVARVDGVLAFVAGAGNDILLNFFRVVAVVVSLLLMLILFGLAPHFQAARQASELELARALSEVEETREAWTSAWNLADQDWIGRGAPEKLQSVGETATLAASLFEEEQFSAAVAAYREAENRLAEAIEEAERSENELNDARNAWTAKLQSRDQSLLRKYAAATYVAVEQRAAEAERLSASGGMARATAAYREALDLLGEALIEVRLPLLVSPFYVRQATERREDWAKRLGQPVEMTNSLGMKLTLIPPGEFVMGSTVSASEIDRRFPGGQVAWYEAEHPPHTVRITRPYYLGTHEVTVGDFERFVTSTGFRTTAEKEGKAWGHRDGEWKEIDGLNWRNPGFGQQPTHPVTCVSWDDALAFCQWLSREEGRSYRLPTEAEWEYACRAGTDTLFFWGDDPDAGEGYLNGADLTGTPEGRVWSNPFNFRDGYAATSPVGHFKPNAFGLHDMSGNVREWCADWFADYTSVPVDDPSGPITGSDRVSRGGGWYYGARHCRAASRYGYSPGDRDGDLGFRVAFSSVDGSGQ